MNILCRRVGLLLTFAALPSLTLADPPVPAASVTVPILTPKSLNGHSFIVVPTKINNAGPFLLILDSGAERNVADPSLPREANLKIQGGGHIKGIGPQTEGSLQTEETTLQLGAATVSRQKFMTFTMDAVRKASGIGVSGFLGENIFKAFVVRIDYAHSLLTLTPPDQFHASETGVRVIMPLSFDKAHRPQIDAQVEGIPGKFMIDTGSDATVILNSPFAKKNGLQARYASQGHTITTVGAGGEAKVQVVPSLRLQIGSITITGIPVGLSQAQSGLETETDTAGAFGGALLRHFILTFDYSRKQLIFEPPADLAQAAPTQGSTAKP